MFYQDYVELFKKTLQITRHYKVTILKNLRIHMYVVVLNLPILNGGLLYLTRKMKIQQHINEKIRKRTDS